MKFEYVGGDYLFFRFYVVGDCDEIVVCGVDGYGLLVDIEVFFIFGIFYFFDDKYGVFVRCVGDGCGGYDDE